MYGGVGLPSAKGTGTNGYVERALGYLPKDYKPGSYGEIIRQMKSNPAPIKRKINDEIILHEEKHKIEVELYDLKEKYLKENKYKEKEIEDIINNERRRLYHLLERREADFMDKNETHQKGKLKDAQMKIIKNALKIKDGYYLGEGFEYGLQADEEKQRKKLKKENKKNEKRKYNNEYKKRRKDYYKKDYSYRSSSRSRSRSKSYNKNIKKELNNDYRLNKKFKLAESVFRRSPSHKEEDEDKISDNDNEKMNIKEKEDNNKIENKERNTVDDNDKNKLNNNEHIKENEKDKNDLEKNSVKIDKNSDLNKKEETNIEDNKKNKEDDEHEEGSIDD